MPEVRELVLEPGPRQSADLLQPHPRATTPPTTPKCSCSCTNTTPTRRREKLQALRERLARYPGAHIYVHEFANGPPISAPISVRVIGNDLDVIEQLSHKVEDLVKATPGTRDVKNPLNVVAHQPQAAHRFAQGAAAGRADRRARSRGASVRGRHSGRHVQGDDAASSIPSWCARRSRSRPSSRRWSRCACPRSRGATLPLSQLAVAGIREGADADPALQSRTRHDHRCGRGQGLQRRAR